ncbi:transposase [Pseudomonas aeruginosa]|uniref:transposase n=1 Tax=Pseudomonas aeruginosa TaxID=287 RepID=UPI0018DDDD42|nr:transposase [Pseudomonas aeruginosa]MBH8516358.1 transposase [Pseudomonas aeruginosa]
MSDDIIKYPAQLPHPLQQGYAFETTNPKLSTPMASGYVRERRRTQSVPTRAKVTWNMDSQQAAFFEAWFARTLVDGTKWFEAMLQTPLGFLPYTCRILGMYEGAELVQVRRWEYSATLELRERPLMPPGWEEFPDYWFNMNTLDLAMNRDGHWPEA